MNKSRRQEVKNEIAEINRIITLQCNTKQHSYSNLEAIKDSIESIKSDVEFTKEDEEWAMDSVPENLQYTERYYTMEESVGYLEDSIDNIDEALECITSYLDENKEEDFKNDATLKEALQSIVSNLESAVNDLHNIE